MPDSDLPKLIAVIGPTASGKTALGVFLAQTFNGEIVSADAKQVYRGMDVGTAKEKNLPVPQHLIDVRDPGEKITVGDYQSLAYQAIDQVLEQGKLPVLVGGSGLYAESITAGYLFGGPGTKESEPRYRVLKLGIAIEREELKRRAAQRLRDRSQAIVQEVRGLLDAGVDPIWLESCGIEYRYFGRYAQGEISLDEAIRLATTAIFQFIKRQYTWWRRHGDVLWVDGQSEAERAVRDFLAAG